MDKKLIYPMTEKYQEYLIDESKFTGTAESISFPESEAEIMTILKEMKKSNTPITIQGGKTGIVGGAVPLEGHIMNMQAMNRMKEFQRQDAANGFITVEAGMSLAELQVVIARETRKNPLIWPPNPTESTASIGGILAAAAKGIEAFHYGDTRQYVRAIRLIDGRGNVQNLDRRDQIDSHPICKILGGEGIYGIITEATLILVADYEEKWGISFFFRELSQADSFIRGLLAADEEYQNNIIAAEYFDKNTIDQIEAKKSNMAKIKEIPNVAEENRHMVYVEIGGSEEEIEQTAVILMELAEESGSDAESAWAVSGEIEIRKLQAFRHAAAETTNLLIEEARRTEPRITKLGTDIPQRHKGLKEAVEFYLNDLHREGLDYCIFGHCRDMHLHVNILPKTYEEYQKGKEMIGTWIKRIHHEEGKMVVEHGIGKLKKKWRGDILSAEEEQQMLELKAVMDPDGIWNKANIFGDE
ncbi:MAG: FAD-binding oxidoreductase [Lachnospiraceae bacterium]